MNYATSYANLSTLVETIRASAAQGKSVKVSSGLAARLEGAPKVEVASMDEVRAKYMSQIQDMFAVDEQTPAFTPVEEKMTGPVDTPTRGGSSRAYNSEDANRIKEKLVARGMPPHIADGVVMNFVDESGLNPLINEKNPLVKGSRGGFGLYQLTGPRRVAYERYAAEQGIDTSNPQEQEDAQLQFLWEEIKGSEKNNWDVVQSAPDAGTAAAYFAKYFLRPSKEHLNARIEKYTGRPVEYVLRPQARE